MTATPRSRTPGPVRRRRRASAEWEGRDVITVASLPGRGLYARHLGHPEGVDGVHRPTVVRAGALRKPPATFEPGWLARHLDGVQLVHVHAVPGKLSPDQVAEAVRAVRAAGRPLVATAYHLSDPTGLDKAGFAAQLDALLPAADEVITLTRSAAEEIARRWSVAAVVVPHPHAVDFVRMRRPRSHPAGAGRAPLRIGAQLGALRLPGDPVEQVRALARAVGEVPQARLEVHVHDHLLDPEASRYDPVVIREIDRVVTGVGGVLLAHRPFSDAQLWDHLLSLDVSFVPPLNGSHSIWPEACFDVGTHALMTAGSHAAGQHPGLSYRVEGSGAVDVDSLHAALLAAQRQGAAPRADPAERWKERVSIAETLRASYERLLAPPS